MTTAPDAPDVGLDLVAATVTAKLARDLGCPRLAVAAARRAGELADLLVVSVSPMLSATSVEAEYDRLGDVRCTGQLAALLAPEPTEGPT